MKKSKLLLALLVAQLRLAQSSHAITLAWDFEFCVQDTLEVSTDGKTWSPVPGPYHLNDTGTEYRVHVPNDTMMKLFRVSRIFGDPIVPATELPGHNRLNSQNCPNQ